MRLLNVTSTLTSHPVFFTTTLKSYFNDPWNTFDFVTVVGSIIDALAVEFAVSSRNETTDITSSI